MLKRIPMVYYTMHMNYRETYKENVVFIYCNTKIFGIGKPSCVATISRVLRWYSKAN